MSAQILNFNEKESKKENKCSFCNTVEKDCKTLIKGIVDKFICDNCLQKCNDLIKHNAK